ncbi:MULTISPECIES: ParB/RepB/Spo0J family partition protein [unclassified Clostridium]|uniref:ParB/RepB/Spo0J family partition protein n=1 Tax=unclassified Clostridium TaxID=2614128 RepID=UPI001106FFA6|nr:MULTISPECIES: ParB/RepB/Spo0J family partition protein [unclassified Clostridium]
MSAKKSGGLGRGLGALIATSDSGLPDWAQAEKQAETAPEQPSASGGIQEIPLRLIDPNPDQPRQTFDPEALKVLAASIKTHGVLQPILLAPQEKGRYRIIAGERRWRAAKSARLKTIPALVREVELRDQMELALVENLQRQDLNPIEEAVSIRALMDEFSLTQEAVAERIGRSRPAVANCLRLLALPAPIQQMLKDGRLNPGQARPLVALDDSKLQLELAEQIAGKELSARQAEQLVKAATKPPKPASETSIAQSQDLALVQETMRRAFGTRIEIKGTTDKGKIQLEYYSREDLERIYELAASLGPKGDD